MGVVSVWNSRFGSHYFGLWVGNNGRVLGGGLLVGNVWYCFINWASDDGEIDGRLGWDWVIDFYI